MNKKVKSSNKCPICGKSTHKKSQYCIFHASVAEKTEKDFKKALKEYIQEIKEKDRDYDFERFVFIGEIISEEDLNVTIFKHAVFKDASFEGDTSFWNTTFKGYADFQGVTFKGYIGFKGVTFKGYADFKGVTFKGYADFSEATFKENACFNGVIFEGYAGFHGATFKKDAAFGVLNIKEAFNHIKGDSWKAIFQKINLIENKIFGKVIFEGYADFSEATFKEDACFNGATFKEDADFRLKYFVKNLYFSKINVFSGKKIFIRLNNEGGKVFFERSYLENTYLDIELVEGILIDFTDVSLRNTTIEKDKIENHILQEKKKNYHEAKEIYVLLKNNFHSIGQYENESWALKKEKDMERKSFSFPYYKKMLKDKSKKVKFPILKWIKKGDFKKWVISVFSNMIYGYGEKPWNVVIVAGALIIVFAYFFSLIGIGNPEIIESQGKIHPIPGTDMRLVSEGVLLNTKIMQFSSCLYFSLITFTTLGYGDFRPLEGLGRILAGSEAFIGAFMMALFVYTFARRTGGREIY